MKKHYDLGHDPVLKIFVGYAIPAIMGMVVMSVASIVDGFFVGRYVGPEGLAAVNLTMPLLHVMVALAVMFVVGGSTYTAIELGAKRLHNAANGFTVTLILVSGLSLGSTLIGYLFLPQLVSLLGADEATTPLLREYLYYLLPFMVSFLLAYGLDTFVRRDGWPAYSVACVSIGSALNILLDYLMVGVWGMGLKGAAIATGLAQTLSMLLLCIHFVIHNTSFKLVRPNFHWKMIKDMLYNGSSELLATASFGLVGFLYNRIIMARLGATGVAAYAVVLYAASIGMWVIYGVADAVGPGVSFNFGARQKHRILAFLRLALITSIAIGVVWFVILNLFHEPLARLFTKDADSVAGLASEVVRYYSPAFLVMGVNIILAAYFTALSMARQSLMVSLSRTLIVISAALIVLPKIFGDVGIWLAAPVTEGVTLFLSLWLLRQCRLDHLDGEVAYHHEHVHVACSGRPKLDVE
ncbi:MATE family efflux transporter [bacterium]|nr:MATE family efflux transporter [bacterium]